MARRTRVVTDVEIEQRAAALSPGCREQLRQLLDDLWERRAVLSTPAPVDDDTVVEYLVWPEYTDSALDLHVMLSRCGLVVPFDWSGWASSVSLRLETPPMQFSVADAVRYLTYVVRSDPSAMNAFGTSIVNGSLLHAVETVLALEP
jgi:hypothetical protein